MGGQERRENTGRTDHMRIIKGTRQSALRGKISRADLGGKISLRRGEGLARNKDTLQA